MTGFIHWSTFCLIVESFFVSRCFFWIDRSTNNETTHLSTWLVLSVLYSYTTINNLLVKESNMSILDEYFMKYPNSQNAIDIFHGEWSSIIPGNIKSNGNADLFNDPRIDLICDKIGDLRNANILELGPLEGGHTYMLSKKLNARSVTAIEANSRAYLKCLIIKELLEMNSVSFMLGDFDQYLDDCNTFDLILACGVIYHCRNPIETIVKITNRTQKVGLWSHYFKESEVRSIYGNRFSYIGEVMNYKGYTGTVYKHNYSDRKSVV